MSSVFMKSCTSAFNVAEFKAQRWDGHFSPWWSASVKLSRRRAAPQWFIGASAACLRSIMAPNPSRPRYCHNGNMCVVTVWYSNDHWYYCRGPSPFAYINTQMRVRTLPPYGAHARTGSVPIQSFEEPPPQKGRLNISRSNNLSQALRVALVSPSALRTRWLI